MLHDRHVSTDQAGRADQRLRLTLGERLALCLIPQAFIMVFGVPVLVQPGPFQWLGALMVAQCFVGLWVAGIVDKREAARNEAYSERADRQIGLTTARPKCN